MSAELFNEAERELIEAARMILGDGVSRLSQRAGMFPIRGGRSARAEVLEARNALIDYLVATYGPMRRETAACCLIDAQGRLISIEDFPEGKETHCEIDPRLLAGMIVRSGAVGVILVHNHPSGDNTPSNADVKLTAAYSEWLRFMNVDLIDHLVVNTSGASSIRGAF